MASNNRIKWIDYSKAFACLLVVIGHLLMSLRAIDNYRNVTDFIVWFIYLFHMPLFMFLSGILYHKQTNISTLKDYKTFEFKKIINLAIPYVTFYSITMILSMIFSNSVNTPKGLDEWIGIINNPMAPYWFLYALLSIFIIVPLLEKLFKNNKNIVLFIFAILKIISIFIIPNIYFIKSIMMYGFYFYLGAFIKIDEKNDNNKNYLIIMLPLLFFILAIVFYLFKGVINGIIIKYIEILFAIAGIFVVTYLFKYVNKSKFFDTYKKYTLHIFLMHTIFAAGIRIVMYNIGIYNYFVHLIIGLLFSIYIPVLVGIISDKIGITNFFFYPLKTIEEYKKGKKQWQKRS